MRPNTARDAVLAYLKWYARQNPNAKSPMPGIHSGHSFIFDASGAPFTKAGEVMVDILPALKFQYADLWKEAKKPRGQLELAL